MQRRGDADESRTEVTIDAASTIGPAFVQKRKGIYESYMASRMLHFIVRRKAYSDRESRHNGRRNIVEISSYSLPPSSA
jgi:hypothetical protein